MVHKDIIKKMISYAGSKHFDKVLSKAKVLSAGNGKCEVELKIGDEDTNVYGTLHGGLSATLVDCISSYALLTHPRVEDKIDSCSEGGVSVEIHMTYLRPARVGEEILVQANTVKLGKTLAFLEVTILNKITGEALVKGTHTKYVA